MKIVVLKFGGTSVGTIKKIKKVADIIEDCAFCFPHPQSPRLLLWQWPFISPP